MLALYTFRTIAFGLKAKHFTKYEMWAMEPKKELSEHEENGKKVTRTTYDDPETKTHVEEVKIEGTEQEPENLAAVSSVVNKL
jgi:hypothetical protein